MWYLAFTVQNDPLKSSQYAKVEARAIYTGNTSWQLQTNGTCVLESKSFNPPCHSTDKTLLYEEGTQTSFVERRQNAEVLKELEE